jgi:hypothetical protein
METSQVQERDSAYHKVWELELKWGACPANPAFAQQKMSSSSWVESYNSKTIPQLRNQDINKTVAPNSYNYHRPENSEAKNGLYNRQVSSIILYNYNH